MICAAAAKGRHHLQSEDCVLVKESILNNEEKILPVPLKGFVCVADGAGGHHGGAYASFFVLEKLAGLTDVSGVDDLAKELNRINDLLILKGKSDPGLSGMDATLTGIWMRPDQNVLIHTGNTRAYIRQGRYLRQITQDHTVYNWLFRQGRPQEALLCGRNEIISCFGGGNPAFLSRLTVMEMGTFNQLLLTSDGVHDYVEIDDLERILNDPSPQSEKCSRILDAARSAGSEDGLTAVLICCQNRSSSPKGRSALQNTSV